MSWYPRSSVPPAAGPIRPRPPVDPDAPCCAWCGERIRVSPSEDFCRAACQQGWTRWRNRALLSIDSTPNPPSRVGPLPAAELPWAPIPWPGLARGEAPEAA